MSSSQINIIEIVGLCHNLKVKLYLWYLYYLPKK